MLKRKKRIKKRIVQCTRLPHHSSFHCDASWEVGRTWSCEALGFSKTKDQRHQRSNVTGDPGGAFGISAENQTSEPNIQDPPKNPTQHSTVHSEALLIKCLRVPERIVPPSPGSLRFPRRCQPIKTRFKPTGTKVEVKRY